MEKMQRGAFFVAAAAFSNKVDGLFFNDKCVSKAEETNSC